MPRTAATYVDACMHSKDHELGSPKHWKSKFEILKSDFFFHDRSRVVLVACTYSWLVTLLRPSAFHWAQIPCAWPSTQIIIARSTFADRQNFGSSDIFISTAISKATNTLPVISWMNYMRFAHFVLIFLFATVVPSLSILFQDSVFLVGLI